VRSLVAAVQLFGFFAIYGQELAGELSTQLAGPKRLGISFVGCFNPYR